jgi:hypothetical protein
MTNKISCTCKKCSAYAVEDRNLEKARDALIQVVCTQCRNPVKRSVASVMQARGAVVCCARRDR